jgi:outer membrane protein
MSPRIRQVRRTVKKTPLWLVAGVMAWFSTGVSGQERLVLPTVEDSAPQFSGPQFSGPQVPGPQGSSGQNHGPTTNLPPAPASSVNGHPSSVLRSVRSPYPPPQELGPTSNSVQYPVTSYPSTGLTAPTLSPRRVPATPAASSIPTPASRVPLELNVPHAGGNAVEGRMAQAPMSPAPSASPAPPVSEFSPRREDNRDLSTLHDELLDTAIRVTQEPPPVAIEQVPPGWWAEMATRPLRESQGREALTLDQAMTRALAHSFQIKVFSELPQIRETAIVEADAVFDWTQFVDTRWNDRSDPIGSSLTAGPGVTRFLDQQLAGKAGLKKKTTTGAQVEIAQNFGYQDNNSIYFIPAPQGTARLTLGFTQPLLRGSGQAYNTSLTYLASIDKDIADDELCRQIQGHLLEVSRAYWATYFERGLLYQKLRSYRRAEEIVNHLRPRQELDASQSQIISADAALTERKSDLSRAFAAVRNAEARLRALINDPALGTSESVEIVPIDRPAFIVFPVELQSSISEAFHARPEVAQALKQIKAAGIRKNMSQNELLPMLNLVTEAYVAGLQGSGDIGNAWVEQFNTGRPSYTVGLVFEIPLGNRAARVRDDRRAMELRQLQNQYAVTLETVRLEVEVAVREVQTSQQELLAKSQAVKAREDQLFNLTERWSRLPPTDATTPLLLENILDAQALLAATEQEYLKSQVTYSLSLQGLRRATGSLMQVESAPTMPAPSPASAPVPSPPPRTMPSNPATPPARQPQRAPLPTSTHSALRSSPPHGQMPRMAPANSRPSNMAIPPASPTAPPRPVNARTANPWTAPKW